MIKRKKSLINMPKDLSKKCHAIIHSAAAATAAEGLIPIPLADHIPMTATQVGMIVGLGKVFDLTISESVAKACIGVGLAYTVGSTIFRSFVKIIPGVGLALSASTAFTVTESLGWIIADDFYRIYIGEKPENLVGAGKEFQDFWKDTVKNRRK